MTAESQEQGRAVISEERIAELKAWSIGNPAQPVEPLNPFEVAALLDAYEENRRLREFAEYVLDTHCWGRYDTDGGDTQGKAEKLGIIVEVPASPEFRDEYDAETMYACAWSDAARTSNKEES